MKKNNLNTISRRNAIAGLGAASISAAFFKSKAQANSPVPTKPYQLSPWVEKLTALGKNPMELYGPCNGLSTILLADDANTKINTLLVAWDMPNKADYGVHYHSEYELIYVLQGQLIIEMAEYNGTDGNPLKGTVIRNFTYQKDLSTPMQTVLLTDEINQYTINEKGWIKIPGYCYHSVLPQQNDCRILAYLPDAIRHDETPAKQWKTCPIESSEQL